MSLFGVFSGDKSANTSTTQYSAVTTDQRMVNDGGSVGVGGANNALTLTTASNTNTVLSDSGAIAMGGNVAVTALQSNATNTAKLLDTADALFANGQKALDISATLAGLLASKASGTPDTGLQTAGASNTKAWAIAAVCALGLVLLLKHR